MLFQSVAIGLVHQLVETFLVDVFFTELTLHKGTWGFSPAKSLNINFLYQFAKRLIRSFFQLLPGKIDFQTASLAGNFSTETFTISSNNSIQSYFIELERNFLFFSLHNALALCFLASQWKKYPGAGDRN